jgi:thiol-disulfide isomerase/thioredoxin
MRLEDLEGGSVVIGGAHPDALATFVLFISPTCPVCKSLVPTAKSLAKKEAARMRLIFASDGDSRDQHVAYARDLGLDGYPYVLSQALGMTYQVSKLPFALLIGGDGTDSGIATLQEYVGRIEAEANIDSPVKEQRKRVTASDCWRSEFPGAAFWAASVHCSPARQCCHCCPSHVLSHRSRRSRKSATRKPASTGVIVRWAALCAPVAVARIRPARQARSRRRLPGSEPAATRSTTRTT